MRILLSIGLAATLSACGAFTTPVIVAEKTAAGDVQIVPINAANIRAANSSGYTPKTLPAIFSQTAGLQGGGRGYGATPDPVFEEQSRPANLETRPPPAVQQTSYRIGTGDVVTLSTPSTGSTAEELTGLLASQNRRNGYVVQDDGSIAIPDVGRVQISGLSIEEAEAQVFDALVGAGIEPSFSLEVSEFNSQAVALGGDVANQGLLPITLRPLRLIEAISRAGGLTVDSERYSSIRIYRDGTMYQIPVEQYLRNTDYQKLLLTDGDSVYVDSAFDLDKAQAYFQQQILLQDRRVGARADALSQLSSEIALRRGELSEARSNFQNRIQLDAIDRDYVYIAGEVGRQGRFTMPFERKATLADALFDEGRGVPNETGNIGEVYVLRGTGDGTNIRAWHLNAYNAANLILATQFELRPNDVIFVSEKPLNALNRLLGQVASTIAFLP